MKKNNIVYLEELSESCLNFLDFRKHSPLEINDNIYRHNCRMSIEVLAKENAELKTDYEILGFSVDDFGELQDEFEKEQEQRTF